MSDIDGAAQQGVMIRLVTEKGRVRLRVNVESARAAQLIISSNLLRSAEIVARRGRRSPYESGSTTHSTAAHEGAAAHQHHRHPVHLCDVRLTYEVVTFKKFRGRLISTS